MDEKTLTMDELKSTIEETIKSSSIVADLDAVKKGVEDLKSTKSVNNDAEVSAKFIRDLCEGKLEAEKKTITTGNGSFGYTVPTTLATAVHEAKSKVAKIRKNAFVFQMDGKFQLPVEGTGVTAYWVTTEADSDITEGAPTVNKKDLDDNYLATRVRVPYKLLNTSAVNVTDYVARLSARSLASTEETAFVAGDGSSKPTGIRLASITDIPQAGANLTYDDLVNLFYGVPEQYRANASFLASPMAIKLIRKLKDTYGMPIFSVQDQTLFGRPLLETVDIPENLGTGGAYTEMYFGDLQEYWIKDGQNMIAETRAVPGRLQVDLFLYESVDGVVVNTDAFRKMTAVK